MAKKSETRHKIGAIIVAAGKGTRMQSTERKPYLKLGSRPLLYYALLPFQTNKLITEIVVVVAAGEEDRTRREVIEEYSFDKVTAIVKGGRDRQDSVYCGLEALSMTSRIAVVHDGARPFLREDNLKEAIKVALDDGAAVLAVPVKSTIKEADAEGRVIRTIARERLWEVQTPQVFGREELMHAHRLAAKDSFFATDDAMLLERIGKQVRLVRGDYENIKITTEEDLIIAEEILRRRKDADR